MVWCHRDLPLTLVLVGDVMVGFVGDVCLRHIDKIVTVSIEDKDQTVNN